MAREVAVASVYQNCDAFQSSVKASIESGYFNFAVSEEKSSSATALRSSKAFWRVSFSV